MRVLVTESTRTMGGQELAVLLQAAGLQKRGHDVRLVLEPGSPIAHRAARQGLPVEELSMRRWRFPLAIVGLAGMLHRHRPQILHVNSSRDSWIGVLASRLLMERPAIVRSRHISTPLNRNITTRLLYRWLFDMVIVTGEERTRRALIERDGLAPERVAAFPIGIDLAEFSPGTPAKDLRAELGLPAGQRLVGLISYLRAYKGHEYFIEAAEQVLHRHQDVTFVIVGEGPLEPVLRELVAKTGRGDAIRMLGYREDLLDVFRSLDVFVIPSVEADTIPQVLMQAMALGLPIVSTTVGSIPDVVKDGETGFVVPPRDARALARTIATLLEAPTLRVRMGAKAHELVARHYSLDAMLARLEGVYTAALGKVKG